MCQLSLHFITKCSATLHRIVFVISQVVVTQLQAQILVDLIATKYACAQGIVGLIAKGQRIAFIYAIKIGPAQFGTAIPGVILAGCLGIGRQQTGNQQGNQ